MVPIDPALPADLDLEPGSVWYVSYGSNMHLDRLAHYIRGGRPPGSGMVHPGCRDTRMPRRSIPVVLRGAMYFATQSRVWGGGRAFYDPEVDASAPARAHLISVSQFSDIAAQEMYREPGVPIDLTEVLVRGRAALGDGRYETLVCPGHVDGVPAVTFTAPWRMSDVPWHAPSAAYLRNLASGLVEAGVWDDDGIASYLAACPGAAGHWTARAIGELIRKDRRAVGRRSSGALGRMALRRSRARATEAASSSMDPEEHGGPAPP